MIELTVINGTNPGKTARFDTGRVTLGRDRGNDVSIQDSFVSSWHGEIHRQPHGYVYTDLRSRHGTTVSIRDQIVQLYGEHTDSHSCYLSDGAHIQLGETVIQLSIGATGLRQRKSADAHDTWKPQFRELVSSDNDPGKTLHAAPADLLARNFARRDPRLKILMHLSSQLNGLNRLPEILDLIVEATFVAFPLTHCFYIGLLEENELLTPFVTQFASEADAVDPGVVLSPILIERVAESRTPILYVRGGDYGPLSLDFVEGPTRSSMYVPMVGQRKLLGVITVTSRSRDRLFSTQDLELFSVLASTVAFSLERAQMTEDMYQMFEGFVRASVVAIEARDPTTAGHSERVAAYTIALAEEIDVSQGELTSLHFSRNALTELRYAALLHDFGKVGVRESVLNKAKRLSDSNLALVRQRFETFKERKWRCLLHAMLERTLAEPALDARAELKQVEAAHRAEVERLDKILSFVDGARNVRSLDDAMLTRVKELHEATIGFGADETATLFLEHELQDLGIRYGTLNSAEWDDMRSHAMRTEYFLSQIPWSRDLSRIPCIAGAHHEKLNGSGYPNGLSGDAILPQVRIMTIADIFDALTATDRPYRRACSIADAVDILWQDAERDHLDARFVELFAKRVVPQVRHLVPGR